MSKGIFDRVTLNKAKLNTNIINIRESYQAEEFFANKNKPLEDNLYKEYVRCNRGKKFLDIDHIDALGIKYDILIVTSIKNTGKNVGIIYKMFNHHYKKGEKILFLRTSRKEIDETMDEYNNTDRNPFFFKNKNKIIKAFHKETGEETGSVIDFKFCNSRSGGEFKDYGAVFYDECIPWDTKNMLKPGHYLNWAALMSSISRNKPEGIKVYCVGNLQGNNVGLLDFYGIKRDDNLRYIERFDKDNPENICRILYINVNDIYDGIKRQVGVVQGMAPEYKTQLFQNKCDINNLSIINPKDWEELEPVWAFILVLSTTLKQLVIEVKENKPTRYEPNNKIYAIRIRDWAPYYTIRGGIYTDSPIVHNANNCTTLIDNIEEELYNLNELTNFDNVYYYDKNSQDIALILCDKVRKWTKIKYY